ncbi:hypothetical protein CKF54_04375 [Psittacicella hinzii]|uniref:Uncharacterized protein n=2 Tax=Psittacicella hinzii TaxID=2028575 RepID=A0A3A1Y9B2_9GAMM|nr:hypothetical protein CKF54_04375 [Psittacicella hinzii]
MFILAGSISFILYVIGFHTFHLMDYGAYDHTLLLVLAFALLNVLYLFFTRSNFAIDIAQKYKDTLFSRKTVVFCALAEAIIALYAFVMYMHHPIAFSKGLEEPVLEVLTGNNTVSMLLLAVVACRFFYVLTVGTYRVLTFWLSFIAALGVFGGVIYYFVGFTESLAYIPAIIYFAILVALKVNHRFLITNDSKQITFASVIPYVLRTLGGLLEPLCLSLIIYFVVVYFIGAFL